METIDGHAAGARTATASPTAITPFPAASAPSPTDVFGHRAALAANALCLLLVGLDEAGRQGAGRDQEVAGSLLLEGRAAHPDLSAQHGIVQADAVVSHLDQ